MQHKYNLLYYRVIGVDKRVIQVILGEKKEWEKEIELYIKARTPHIING